MSLPDGVHAFTQAVEQDGVENTIHPSAVETPKGLLLVDVGYRGSEAQIEANLESAGFEWDNVRAVVLTHQDGDHAGTLSAVVDRTNAVVYAHERCTPYVDGRIHPIKMADGDRYEPVDVDVELVGGVSFRTEAGPMEVVFTPGHTPGHVALYLPEARSLLAGDALTADESGLLGPSEQYTLEMEEALDSAAELATREIETVLCHHGGVVETDGDRIHEIVDSMR